MSATANSRSKPLRRAPHATALEVLRATTLEPLPWLVHGFSTRPGGVSTCYQGLTLNLGFTPDDTRENVEQNREAFLLSLGASGWPLVQVKQIHSATVHHVTAASASLTGDGLITATRGLLLAVKTADCV